jgi:hypothetical protein
MTHLGKRQRSRQSQIRPRYRTYKVGIAANKAKYDIPQEGGTDADKAK